MRQFWKTLFCGALLAWSAFALPVQASPLDLETPSENLLLEQINKKIRKGAYFLLGIQKKIAQSDDELNLLRKNRDELQTKMNKAREDSTRLEEQLENLQRLADRTSALIRAGEIQMAAYDNEIANRENEIARLSAALQKDIDALRRTITAYYIYNNAFFAQGEANLLAFLASQESAGEILQKQQYLGMLQQAGERIAQDILEAQKSIDQKKEALEEKRAIVQELAAFLTRENRTLAESRHAKERLLAQTKGKEVLYAALLENGRREEADVSIQIEDLKRNYDFFRQKLDALEIENPGVPTSPLDLSFGTSTFDLFRGSAPLAWPVSPALGISAYFHDEDYKKSMGSEHQAVDIRIPSGTEVRSARTGIVSKVIDNGFAYSYVVIAHPDDFLTLYGHLSQIFVQPGEVVREGGLIGLSGGIPGTKGAGWLTTGAHLHFEVFKNFTHVDPLDYLPLEYVSINSLPEKYLKKLMEEEKVKRETAPGSLE